MGMLKMELDDPAVIRRRRRLGPPHGEQDAPATTTRRSRRLTVTTLDVRPRLAGCI